MDLEELLALLKPEELSLRQALLESHKPSVQSKAPPLPPTPTTLSRPTVHFADETSSPAPSSPRGRPLSTRGSGLPRTPTSASPTPTRPSRVHFSEPNSPSPSPERGRPLSSRRSTVVAWAPSQSPTPTGRPLSACSSAQSLYLASPSPPPPPNYAPTDRCVSPVTPQAPSIIGRHASCPPAGLPPLEPDGALLSDDRLAREKSMPAPKQKALPSLNEDHCHFCADCERLIIGDYYVKEGLPYDEACHDERFGLRCSVCSLVMKGTYTNVGTKSMHKDCFKCVECREVITGSYKDDGSEFYHPSCYDLKHAKICTACNKKIWPDLAILLDSAPYHKACFTCAECRETISGSYKGKEGLFYHPLCYDLKHAKICTVCDQKIHPDAPVLYDSKSWHRACFRCEHCSCVIDDPTFKTRDGKLYHVACYSQCFDPRCYVCKLLIKAVDKGEGPQFYFFTAPDFPGLKACTSHDTDGTPTCIGCGRYCSQSRSKRRFCEDYTLCLECQDVAICDLEDAKPVFDIVYDLFQRKGLTIPTQPTLHLLSYAELNPAQKVDAMMKSNVRKPGYTLGVCETTISYVTREDEKQVGSFGIKEIRIMGGLPLPRTASVMAHELMHSYLAYCGAKTRGKGAFGANDAGWGLDPMVEEGTCELAAYLILLQGSSGDDDEFTGQTQALYERLLARRDIRKMFESQDPIYGDGFRAAKAAYDKVGLFGVIEHVRQTGKFPE